MAFDAYRGGYAILPYTENYATARARLTKVSDEIMEIIEEHSSQDNTLKIIVTKSKDNDIAIGFEGATWHTHPDIFSKTSNLTESEAIRKFIDDIIQNRCIIAVSHMHDKLQDIWITDDPKTDIDLKENNETLEFRYWNGKKLKLS